MDKIKTKELKNIEINDNEIKINSYKGVVSFIKIFYE